MDQHGRDVFGASYMSCTFIETYYPHVLQKLGNFKRRKQINEVSISFDFMSHDFFRKTFEVTSS